MKLKPKPRWPLAISVLVVLLGTTLVWQTPSASGKSTAKSALGAERLRRVSLAP